jgi:hypothetical protein
LKKIKQLFSQSHLNQIREERMGPKLQENQIKEVI